MRALVSPDAVVVSATRFEPLHVTGWPYDLTDDALLDSIRDAVDIPSTRRKALDREARRRGLRAMR